MLPHREDLIEQLKRHVQEFNTSRNDLYIRLRELKEYAEAKRESPSLFGAREMTVFYYRSDNLSDEQKERIIDFRNCDDSGKWYRDIEATNARNTRNEWVQETAGLFYSVFVAIHLGFRVACSVG